ncbi:hypothetical protein EYZ11_001682 [Aspergillus tanneri]|uniref:Tetrapyrrole biosynthesis uroporphyrinogen III synthase domain-containing protein n=1 Tax=Aspergillus tanneri TaxID=1220188 RepID=A0A4S3JT41_9EURO|nr:uncharacterized protein ATNIH1004_002436 [Aspergillus tanneri]KAA8649762.1 hypothetical protein ATNIH1004_002436 [Aspergillus tanneri]THC98835.1 hypothetical protein EYZ11_001682 [Aspergillus tanneri]
MPPSFSFPSSSTTPILLLKTKSTPADGYNEFFSTHNYNPAFIPVLEHHFHDQNLQTVRHLFKSGALNPGPGRKYGGLIFTSQRAVEGFAKLLDSLDESISHSASQDLILYTVGPATSRSLTTLRDTHLRGASIHGSDCGNGESLARYILTHYNRHYSTTSAEALEEEKEEKVTTYKKPPPPLLFLVGEQRRDIISKTLMGADPPQRIAVDELVVYETGVMESFEEEFGAAMRSAKEYLTVDTDRVVWVVVFSPTGCEAMLKVLGATSDDTDGNRRMERVFVATIGPTTREHLRNQFGFVPEVCAEKPSPEGVGLGIEMFMERAGL